MRSVLTIVFLCVFVSGCSTFTKSAPTNKYYILGETPRAGENDLASLVVVKRVVVPDYLKQRKLVLREQKQQLTIANFHNWVDDLPLSIQRLLTLDLNRNTEQFKRDNKCEYCNELVLNVDHFYPTDAGTAVLAGSYSLTHTKKKGKSQQYFSYENELKSDGYAEAVYQMRQLLLRLSDDIKTNALSDK